MMIKSRLLHGLLLFAFAGALLASSTVTETKGSTVLHAADGSSKTFKDAPGLTAHDACVRAAQGLFKGTTPSETSKCWDETAVTVLATCDDVKAPTIPLTKNGDTWEEPEAAAFPVAGADTEWTTLQWLYVHNQTWPKGYPDCWVRGWAPPEEWRVNGADPNAVFMEKLEQGMADLPDVPLSVEPYYLPGEEPKA